jgi:uncharacterized protein YukE
MAVTITKKIAEGIHDGVKEVNAVMNATQKLDRNIDDLMAFVGVMNPFLVPTQLVVDKITAGTIDESMKTMQATLNLIATPQVQFAIKEVSRVVSEALAFLTTMINGMTALFDGSLESEIKSWVDRLRQEINTMIVALIRQIQTTVSNTTSAVQHTGTQMGVGAHNWLDQFFPQITPPRPNITPIVQIPTHITTTATHTATHVTQTAQQVSQTVAQTASQAVPVITQPIITTTAQVTQSTIAAGTSIGSKITNWWKRLW